MMTAYEWCSTWAVTPQGWDSIDSMAKRMESTIGAYPGEQKTEDDWSSAYHEATALCSLQKKGHE